MLTVTVYNESGQQVGSEQIDPALLGGKVNASLLKQAAVMYLANQRQGNVAQKTRGEVEGSTRKIYKQKGTGRARMGPVRQPVRRGGGRAFPRKQRDFRKEMPAQMRRLARNNAVLSKIENNSLFIVDGLKFDQPTTKRFASMLKAVKAESGCLLATHGRDENLYRSGRNIPATRVIDVAELNAHDILKARRIGFTREAFVAFRDAASHKKAGA
jgi:large subunit ribosomal protein L4